MNKNFCNQGSSVFLTFLGTEERKMAFLASEAFDTGLQVKKVQLWPLSQSTEHSGTDHSSLCPPREGSAQLSHNSSVSGLQPLWKKCFFSFQRHCFACYSCSHPLRACRKIPKCQNWDILKWKEILLRLMNLALPCLLLVTVRPLILLSQPDLSERPWWPFVAASWAFGTVCFMTLMALFREI